MVLFEASGYRLPFPSFPTRRSSDLIDDALGIIRPALLMQAHVGDCLFTTAISNAANFITLACLCLRRQNNHQAMALPPSSPIINVNGLGFYGQGIWATFIHPVILSQPTRLVGRGERNLVSISAYPAAVTDLGLIGIGPQGVNKAALDSQP